MSTLILARAEPQRFPNFNFNFVLSLVFSGPALNYCLTLNYMSKFYVTSYI